MLTGSQIRTVLWEATRQELVERLEGAYSFVHGRIHEAAYSRIPKDSRDDLYPYVNPPFISTSLSMPCRLQVGIPLNT